MDMNQKVQIDSKVIYSELSYKIIKCAFKVYNENGYGMSEKFYQNALAKALEEEDISFQRECMVVKELGGKSVIRWFLDFLIENKIVVELKIRHQLGYVQVKQAIEYLKVSGYKLAILVYFTKDGVKFRRILNAS